MTLSCIYVYYTLVSELCSLEAHFISPCMLIDPAYQGAVPILDGGVGRSEDVITIDPNDLPVEQPLPPQTERYGEEGKADDDQ